MGGALATGRGLRFTSHSPKCFKIFFITSGSSMNEIIRIAPKHLGHTRGSTFRQKTADRLRFFVSIAPNFAGKSCRSVTVQGSRGFYRRRQSFFVFHAQHCYKIRYDEPSVRPCWARGSTWQRVLVLGIPFAGHPAALWRGHSSASNTLVSFPSLDRYCTWPVSRW
jgi:hypothetical protein